MTETAWLAGTDPLRMLDFLAGSGQASDRKLRLFAVACCRRVWDFLDDLGRGAVDMAELFAEGRTGTEELRAARLACKAAGARAVWYAAASNPAIAARNAALSIQSGVAAESIAQANLLRDIVGNPFCPVALDPSWLTPAVVGLAAFIDEERAFDRLRDLADVLQGQGCRNRDILNHCREPGPHSKGCWLIDQLLGKSGL